MKFPTKRNPNGIRRAVKYGPMQGELVFLECQMDEEIFEIVQAHPFVQDFADLHPFNPKIPLPCSDLDRQDAEDWIWDLELPKAESMDYKREPSRSPEEPVVDIAFAVDKLVNGKNDIGFVTVFDETREAADELGEEWKQRRQRQERKRARQAQRAKQRRNLTPRRRRDSPQRHDLRQQERRLSKGGWKTRNLRKEREMAEMAEDYEVTEWFEGDDSFESHTEASEEQDEDPIESKEEEKKEEEVDYQSSEELAPISESSSVTVIEGPFSDYNGVILQESDGNYLVQVNVFGEDAMLTLKDDQFRRNEVKTTEEVEIL